MLDRIRTCIALLALAAWLCAGFAANTVAQMAGSGQDQSITALIDGKDSAAELCLGAPEPLGDGIDQPSIPFVRPASCIGKAPAVVHATIQPPSPRHFSWQGRAPPAA